MKYQRISSYRNFLFIVVFLLFFIIFHGLHTSLPQTDANGVKEEILKYHTRNYQEIKFKALSKGPTNSNDRSSEFENNFHKSSALSPRLLTSKSAGVASHFYRNMSIVLKDFEKPFKNNDDERLRSLWPPNSRQQNNHEDRILKQIKLKLKSKKMKTILTWDLDDNLQNRNLLENNCFVDTCRIITSRNKLASVDAVLFKYIPSRYELNRPKNLSHQVWIMYQLESPMHGMDIEHHMTYINWTATYRTDSVLNTPYEKFVPYPHISSLPKFPNKNYHAGKTKLVAWFVSNCRSLSGREYFVEELQKYIPVDIYGDCGFLKCRDFDCFQTLQRDYMFYLAFENSNCMDYITEKFFTSALQHDIVPVVMGAHPNDYKKLAPPGSYIHVDDFESPRHLANYLQKVSKNPHLYNRYFRWKGTGEFINTKFLCRLCGMLQLSDHFPMYYADLSKWWSMETSCVFPDITKKWATWRKRNNNLGADKFLIRGY